MEYLSAKRFSKQDASKHIWKWNFKRIQTLLSRDVARIKIGGRGYDSFLFGGTTLLYVWWGTTLLQAWRTNLFFNFGL